MKIVWRGKKTRFHFVSFTGRASEISRTVHGDEAPKAHRAGGATRKENEVPELPPGRMPSSAPDR